MNDLKFETKRITINRQPFRILIQNQNGPCALIALINILLLSPQYLEQVSNLTRLVQSEEVFLDDLVFCLADIIVQNVGSSHTTIENILNLLPKLHLRLLIDPSFDGNFLTIIGANIILLFQSKSSPWLVS